MDIKIVYIVHYFIILLQQRILVLFERLVNGVKQVRNKAVREGVQLILFVVLIYIVLPLLSLVHFIKQFPSYFMQESLATRKDVKG